MDAREVWQTFKTRRIGATQVRQARLERIKVEFENGKEYYRFHGGDLFNLPHNLINKPEKEFVTWHNENVFKG